MVLDYKRHPRSQEFLEVNPEPIEPKRFFNPSIQDMLTNPQCMIQPLPCTYLEDEPENIPDAWNDDIQNYYDQFAPKPKSVKEMPTATNYEEPTTAKEQSDDKEGGDD